ncbi:lipocalin-like domain-containing protein [Streptomyces sp. NBC_00726]|uniref:lipocalin-like domain-containing protein n=1 Tax=Streptomyces sp. NBC_00726 TaxID=2903674 RepID=UPI00386E8621
MRREDLVGVWRLVAFHELDDADGRGEGPLGEAPRGRLVYTENGHVSVNMMRTAGEAGGTRYMGYAGTWRLTGGQVVHRIEVTPRPDWVGTEQSRDAVLEGNRLTLRADTLLQGVQHRRVLVWERLG